MKIRFLLIGTSLSLIPTLTSAQCVATQDCATLGYTETSCSGGSGVKCPFGNKWACFKSESEIKQEVEKEFCNEYGFTLSCTGTNQTGGGGKACNGKYSECTCTSGYEWKDGSCQKQVQNGDVGDVFKCNGKVVGVKASGMDFYVAMEDLGTMGWSDANSSCENYSFCGNIKGTLPSKDQLLEIYNNKSTVNNLLSTNGGTELTNDWYWSSTYKYYDYSLNGHYNVGMSNGDVSNGYYDNGVYYVRPVLAF